LRNDLFLTPCTRGLLAYKHVYISAFTCLIALSAAYALQLASRHALHKIYVRTMATDAARVAEYLGFGLIGLHAKLRLVGLGTR